MRSLPFLSRAGQPAAGRSLSADVLPEIIESDPEGILVADLRAADTPIVYANPAMERITGYSRSEILGKNCRYLQGSDRLQPEVDVIRTALAAGTAAQVRLRNYRKDGSLFWNDLRLIPIVDRSGKRTHYVGFIRDATLEVATAGRLEQLIHSDQLTGCLNRDGFVEELSRRPKAARVLLVKIDIAGFHEINGCYGYDLGDALLRETAARLMTMGAALVGRVGNDQFGVAFDIDSGADAQVPLGKLRALLALPFALPGADLNVCFAMGYVTGVLGSEPMTLIRQAGAALADSKLTPLKRPREFAAASEAIAYNRLQMTAQLQRALSAKEFVYYYQPQVDLADGRIVGAEALVRWQHPLFGVQQPHRFMDVAQETGLILDIGTAGLRDVTRFAVDFNRDRASPVSFSFNVSSIELTHRDMVALVRTVLRETEADPAWLTLELTESLLADDSPEMLRIFQGLRDLGVGLSIDDFGTGYSSLRYLERFPLTEIKIDRSFVSGLPQSSTKRVIVDAVIRLGLELGVDVIAEGVESEAERDTLAEIGCRIAQGYLFCGPLSPEEFSKVAMGPK